MIYDCTPPPEKPVPAIIRHLHNIVHPHHKKRYVAVRPLMCGDPDMVEIVVEAPPYPPEPPLVGYVFDTCCVLWPGVNDPRNAPPEDPKGPTPRHGPTLRVVSVPEPGPLPILVLGLLFLWMARPRDQDR